ncbi:hypothetical protein [Paraburkholderia fungorum]|uniref:hypothetical protein n=1 Tax=Paraburkholderia fungorum TaxID=134537 RepID=UPI0038BD2633
MARPKIGIFGALLALGGFLAVRYVQRGRSQGPAARELSRWEGEGGTVATPAVPAGSVAAASAGPATPDATHGTSGPNGTNGSTHPNGDGGAWPFPRS